MEIQKDGDLLLMQLQANLWLDELARAVLYCEKMERYYLYISEHREVD